MRWPAYPDVKGPVADWLGELPSHWSLDRFRHVFRESDERNGTNIVGDMLSISGYRGVETKQYDSDELKRSDEDLAKYRVVRPGQLAVNTMWLNYGGLGISKVEGHMSPDYKAYWVRPGFNPDYLNYMLRSESYVAGYTTFLTGVRPNSLRIDRDSLMSIPVVSPPLVEQEQIVDFLDHETAKIDALIGKQEQLIATLREDRTATITNAVTKGLDPHVKLVDSGVAWLGDMPDHWVSARLKNVILSIDSGTSVNGSDSPAGPDEIGVLKTSCVSAGWFNADANKTVLEEDLSRVTCPVQEGALIVNRANTPLLVGSAGYVSHAPKGLYLSDKLWQVRFGGDVAAFVYYWTQTQVYRSQIAASCVGASSSMQNLSMGDFRSVAIALPPDAEQRSIVDFMSARTATIDSLIAKANEVIEMLREYRSALITDAVTGKIDVRDAVA